ncbi:Clp protease N-terminal domain-containing protein [Granulicoccus sp. GXG6511]|uniref:Clp protease N-terminal domain-containing protein n=1 Tax=Granulicoccus sp. GXG6511 TaxID=3381351 RepID=UPI003D7CC10E
MLERFTEGATSTISLASESARQLGALELSSRHLLLGVLRLQRDAANVLTEHGLTEQALTALVRDYTSDETLPGMTAADADALRRFGIDLSEVAAAVRQNFEGTPPSRRPRRRRLLDRFRGDAISFSDEAKRALENSLVVTVRVNHREITDLHILAGLLEPGQRECPDLLRSSGLDPATILNAVEIRLRGAA